MNAFSRVFLLLFLSVTVQAETTYRYSGVVDQVFPNLPAPFEAVRVGDEFVVDYSLDLTTPDQDTINDLGTFSGAVVNYKVTIGEASAETSLGGVNTVNASSFAAVDTYAVIGIFEDFSTSLAFTDATGAAYSPDDTLATINLGDFPDRSFTVLSGVFPVITGSFDAVAAQPAMPEPASGIYLLLGFAVLLVGRTSRRAA